MRKQMGKQVGKYVHCASHCALCFHQRRTQWSGRTSSIFLNDHQSARPADDRTESKTDFDMSSPKLSDSRVL